MNAADDASTSNVMVPPAGGTYVARPVQLKETRPSSITWHIIWDYELEKLTNISRPIVLGLSTTFLGAVIGFLPTVFGTFERLAANEQIKMTDLFGCIAAGICAAAAIILGIFAWRGQADAQQVKNAVRSREEQSLGGLGA